MRKNVNYFFCFIVRRNSEASNAIRSGLKKRVAALRAHCIGIIINLLYICYRAESSRSLIINLHRCLYLNLKT